MAEEISITRALSELKVLEKRIMRGIEELNPVAVVQGEAVVGGYKNNAEYVEAQNARLQSVNALIERRKAIKGAIVLSNARTVVTIGGETMTVADAIERKSSIAFDESLQAKLSESLSYATQNMETRNVRIREEGEKRAESLIGKETTEERNMSEEYKSLMTTFMDINSFEVVGIKDLGQKVAALRDKIETFNHEVDFVLSESNTTTKISL